MMIKHSVLCRSRLLRLRRSPLLLPLPLRCSLFSTTNNTNSNNTSSSSSFSPPRLFDYATITQHLTVADAIDSVEAAFGALAKGTVEVPLPMHIGIPESTLTATSSSNHPSETNQAPGPGDCHIKGGYIVGTSTFTVKLACVSFYKNVTQRNLPAGSGVFVVVSAVTGAPLAILQENRYLTDVRTGAAGAVALKYCTQTPAPTPSSSSNNTPVPFLKIGFIGCGAIARVMARAAAQVRPHYQGVVYGLDPAHAQAFVQDLSSELHLDFTAAASVKDVCQQCTVLFTQTTGSSTVIKDLDWLLPGTTIIASGSDQPTKQELPVDVLKSASKYIADLTKQTSKVGELRAAIQANAMTLDDVYCELGDLVNGTKPGRENDTELIIVDLTGTGAQDAAIGQVAWNKLRTLPE